MEAGSPRDRGRRQTGLPEAQVPAAGREADRSIAVPARTTYRPTPATNRRPAKRRSLFPPCPPWAETFSPWQRDLGTCPSDVHRPCTRTEILDSFDVMLGAPRTHPQLGDPRRTRSGPLHRLREIGGVTPRKPLSRLTIRQRCPGSALTASAKRLPWSS